MSPTSSCARSLLRHEKSWRFLQVIDLCDNEINVVSSENKDDLSAFGKCCSKWLMSYCSCFSPLHHNWAWRNNNKFSLDLPVLMFLLFLSFVLFLGNTFFLNALQLFINAFLIPALFLGLSIISPVLHAYWNYFICNFDALIMLLWTVADI